MKWVRRVTALILAVALVWTSIHFFTDEENTALGAAPTKLRQEVNITDQYVYAPSGSYATSSAVIGITDNNYTSPTYYFEVVASTTSATNATVKLVNATSSATVASVTVNGTSYTRYRSSAFIPNASTTVEYQVVLGNESVGKGIVAARVVVLQSNTTISNTETQIEIGSATTSASNTTTLPLTQPKYWYYDSAVWDASPTFYAEVSYKSNPVASSTTYNVSATTTPTFYTYTASAGVGYVVGEAWGGGGGGDGVSSAATIGGGGGGGGTYARATTTVAAGSTNRIGVGRGGAEGTARADTASTTLTTASGLVLAAQGGEGATSGTGAATSTLAASIGGVIYAGGSGGDGETTADTGGGGGGAAGPAGYGISGKNAAANGPGGSGGAGNQGSGGAGGAGGNGADDTCDTENGVSGSNNVLGGGGGGGADGDVSSICLGGDGGRPGGGGGGSDEGANTSHLGGPGQLKLTEYIGTVGVAIEEDNGSFSGWTPKQQIVSVGRTSTTTERVRSASFTPTTGRHYRVVASTTNSTAPYDIYNAKVVVQQSDLAAADSSTTNSTSLATLASDDKHVAGQSFTATSGNLTSAVFRLARILTPAGNVTAKLYAHSGTYGTDSVSTGSALATSDAIAASSLPTSNADVTFTFSGANQYAMTAGTKYIITVEYNTSNTVLGNVNVRGTNSDVHSGNFCRSTSDNVCDEYISGSDLYFIVYATGSGINLLEPQYLLAPYILDSGTGLQTRLTSWDSTEWAGSDNAYYLEANAADNSTSVVTLNEAAGTLVTNGTVTSPDNRGRSSALCMPSTGNLDTKATTNNSDIYAVRIIVQVGGTPASCGAAGETAQVWMVDMTATVEDSNVTIQQ